LVYYKIVSEIGELGTKPKKYKEVLGMKKYGWIIIIALFILGLFLTREPKIGGIDMGEKEIKIKGISNLWKGIIGEAVGEGYCGMYAVACCYRNRLSKGMALGCVALKRKDLDEFVGKQGYRNELRAKAVMREVFELSGGDVTNGATHYENVEKYGLPYWAKNMGVVARIGCHTFFKKRNKNRIRNFKSL